MSCREQLQSYLDRLEEILEMDFTDVDDEVCDEVYEIRNDIMYIEDEVYSLNDDKLEKLLDKVKKALQEVINEQGLYDQDAELERMFPDGMDEEDNW